MGCLELMLFFFSSSSPLVSSLACFISIVDRVGKCWKAKQYKIILVYLREKGPCLHLTKTRVQSWDPRVEGEKQLPRGFGSSDISFFMCLWFFWKNNYRKRSHFCMSLKIRHCGWGTCKRATVLREDIFRNRTKPNLSLSDPQN